MYTSAHLMSWLGGLASCNKASLVFPHPKPQIAVGPFAEFAILYADHNCLPIYQFTQPT